MRVGGWTGIGVWTGFGGNGTLESPGFSNMTATAENASECQLTRETGVIGIVSGYLPSNDTQLAALENSSSTVTSDAASLSADYSAFVAAQASGNSTQVQIALQAFLQEQHASNSDLSQARIQVREALSGLSESDRQAIRTTEESNLTACMPVRVRLGKTPGQPHPLQQDAGLIAQAQANIDNATQLLASSNTTVSVQVQSYLAAAQQDLNELLVRLHLSG
jgi:hypothetical protein